jgi:hypothetical protein
MPTQYYVYDYYNDYDDFSAQSKGNSGGNGSSNKGQTKEKSSNPDGKYSSKHIRISLEKKSK